MISKTSGDCDTNSTGFWIASLSYDIILTLVIVVEKVT